MPRPTSGAAQHPIRFLVVAYLLGHGIPVQLSLEAVRNVPEDAQDRHPVCRLDVHDRFVAGNDAVLKVLAVAGALEGPRPRPYGIS